MHHRIGILAAIAISIYMGLAAFLATIIGAAAILLAHGTIQQAAGIRITWRLTDNPHARLWLSFAVVALASVPAQLDSYPAWFAVLLVLACTVAFYVAMERILQPAPHRVRALPSGKTYVDNCKPWGYRWLNMQRRMVTALG